MISRRAFLSLFPKVAAVVAGAGPLVRSLPGYSYIRPSGYLTDPDNWSLGPMLSSTYAPVEYKIGVASNGIIIADGPWTNEEYRSLCSAVTAWNGKCKEEMASKLLKDAFSAVPANNSETCTLAPPLDDVDSA